MTPLLFAAWEKLQPPDFVRVLKLVSVISFRYTVVSGLNTNELEPVYHKAAKALLSGHATSPAEVFQHLKPIYVADDKFIRDFASKKIETTGQRKRLAKFVLCALEFDASGKPCDYETDPGTIEHILPENPSAEWDASFNHERQADFIYRIGNLTLLEANLNRQVGNGLLAEKRATYAGTAYGLTKDIADNAPEDWTPTALNARQQKLATRAAHLWRSDFA